jgi:4-diphosphocytidyl-2-C-methyl-D-erythritol kinase
VSTRSAVVRSFAKINLDLRVLRKRPDGFHELRTVFQTISLADTIRIEFEPSRRTRLELAGNVDIPNNLILRAAEAVLHAAKVRARVMFRLDKRIPMGAGLGGGSSNAAAVLLALPVLAGARLPMARLLEIGTALGSDVPFFLYGGTALGLGRGTELYPLPGLPALDGLLVAPGVHVSTADAYRDLQRPPASLTTSQWDDDTVKFRALVWALTETRPPVGWKSCCVNDFESVVFRRYPVLQSIQRKLEKLGASPARMTGSGSALFGLFDSRERLETALGGLSGKSLEGSEIHRIQFVTRRRYRSAFRQRLAEHMRNEGAWPPQSRYSNSCVMSE